MRRANVFTTEVDHDGSDTDGYRSSAARPAVAVYPDSDKVGVWPGNPGDHVMVRRADGHIGDHVMVRRADGHIGDHVMVRRPDGHVDYWDGER